jgi:hypothetical protein
VTEGEAEIEDDPIEEPDDDAHDDRECNPPTAGRFRGEGDSDKDHNGAGEGEGEFCIEVHDISGSVIASSLDVPNVATKIVVAHLLGIPLFLLEDIGGFGNMNHLFLKSGRLDFVSFSEIPDRHIIKVPGTAFPEGPFGIDSPGEPEVIVELKEGDSLEQILLGVEDLEVVDGILASEPYLIVPNKGLTGLFEDFHQKNVIRLAFGKGNDNLVSDETESARQDTQEEKGEGDSIEAYPAGLHGRDFVISGEECQAEECGHQDAEGKDLQSNARYLIQVIEEDKGWRGVVLDEYVHPREKIDDEIDENKGAHAEEKYLEGFPGDIFSEDGHGEGFRVRVVDRFDIVKRPVTPCQAGSEGGVDKDIWLV